jgi:hypothetical protein
MSGNNHLRTFLAAALCAVVVTFAPARSDTPIVSLDPAKMPRFGALDERFGPYNCTASLLEDESLPQNL